MKAANLAIVIIAVLLALPGCSGKPPSHGTVITASVDVSGLETEDQIVQAIRSSRNALRARMKTLGLKPFAEEAGGNQLRVILPALKDGDLAQARDFLFFRAAMECRMVHPDSEALLEQGITPPGYELLQLKHRSKEGVQSVETLVVKRDTENGLTGNCIEQAYVVPSASGAPKIAIQFDTKGAAVLAEITRQNVGNRLAIVLDGEVHAAPVIRSEIMGGSVEITGSLSAKEAYELVNALQYPFPVPIRIVDEKSF